MDSKQSESILSEEEYLILRNEIEKMAALTFSAHARAKRNQVQVKKTPPIPKGKSDAQLSKQQYYGRNSDPL